MLANKNVPYYKLSEYKITTTVPTQANRTLARLYCKHEALSSESGYGGEITETQTTVLRLLLFVWTLQTAIGY